jgi:hypothetical protein
MDKRKNINENLILNIDTNVLAACVSQMCFVW